MAKKTEITVHESVDSSAYLVTPDQLEKTMTVIKENVGDEGVSPFDLVRAKNPSSDSVKWEIPSLLSDESESVSKMEGIIVYHKNTRAYYPNPYGKGEAEPQCSAQDAVNGVGNPGGTCHDCPLSAWGSKLDKDNQPTRGQACMVRKHLFLLREGTRLPIMFSLPPTSLKSARMFFLELGDRDISYWKCITKLTLETSTKGPAPHPVFKFSMVGVLAEEAATVMDGYREMYEPWLSQSVIGKEEVNEDEKAFDDSL